VGTKIQTGNNLRMQKGDGHYHKGPDLRNSPIGVLVVEEAWGKQDYPIGN